MRKFGLGIAVGFVLAAMTAVIFVFAFARLGSMGPSVPGEAVLTLRMSGDIRESPGMEIPILKPSAPIALYQVRAALHAAAKDSRIKALVLRPENLSAGWATMGELRAAIDTFKASKKPVYAYLRAPGARDYLVALAADRIYMAPEDALDFKGLRLESLYLGESMDKLGVDLEVERIGRYKDAADMFTRESMSDDTRAVLNTILDRIFADMVNTVAERRKKSPDEVRALIDQGPFLAEPAKNFGLVDDLLYEDQFETEMKKKFGIKEDKDLPAVSVPNYWRAELSDGKGDAIALLVAEGSIIRSAPTSGFNSDEVLASNQFQRTVDSIVENDEIKGVILRVNSPGGDAFASDEMLYALKRLSKKKPLVISMGDVAASGGYYIAMTGDPVLASENTITGSIGVIYGKANLRELYNKLGAKKELLTRGRFAAIDSDYTGLDAAAREKLRESVEATYRRFVSLVADARNRPYEEIDPLAQGRVWLGSQAKEQGLLDEIGGLDRAVAMVKEKAKIAKDDEVHLVVYPKPRTFFEELMNSGREWVFDLPILRTAAQVAAPAGWNGQILRRMPFDITIQ